MFVFKNNPVKLTLLACLAGMTLGQTPNITKPTMDIIILHNNDMHARFEQTDALSKVCKEQDVLMSKCYGGFARVAHMLVLYIVIMSTCDSFRLCDYT